MKKFLIATHGELSRELVDTSKLIIGSLTNIEYFCMTTDKSADDAEKEIRSILSNNKDSEEFVVLTDVLVEVWQTYVQTYFYKGSNLNY